MLPWFDLEAGAGGRLGAELERLRALACGPTPLPALPVSVPDDARLVWVACTGGPYACPGREGTLAGEVAPYACPRDPTLAQMASVHFVTKRTVADLRERYAAELGGGFGLAPGEQPDELFFVERTAPPTPAAWSPRRLHIRVAAAKGPFRDAGYAAQVQLTFSVPGIRVPFWDLGCYLRERERARRARGERPEPRSWLSGRCRR